MTLLWGNKSSGIKNTAYINIFIFSSKIMAKAGESTKPAYKCQYRRLIFSQVLQPTSCSHSSIEFFVLCKNETSNTGLNTHKMNIHLNEQALNCNSNSYFTKCAIGNAKGFIQ
jgi:hypothetical protein